MKKRAALSLVNDGRRRIARTGAAAVLLVPGLAGLAACAGRRGAPPDLPELAPVRRNAVRRNWAARIGSGGYGFVPALYDGRLWAASADGRLHGMDAETGKSVVRANTDLNFTAGIGTDGSVLVLTDRDGMLHGFETNGKKRWSTNMRAEAASVPATGAGMAVVRLSDNSVGAYDLADGSIRWRYTRRNPTLVLRQTSAIAMDPGTAYVGLPGGRVVALSLSNGASRWEAGISLPRGSNEIERIADVVALPILNGSSLCAAAFQGRVTCLDRDSGRALWSHNMKAGSGTDLDASRILAVDLDSSLVAFSRSGEQAWKQDALRGRRLGPPTLFNDYAWIGDANGYVHVLAAATGELVGRVATDGSQIFAAPLPVSDGADSRVVVQTAGGMVASVSV